MLEQDLNEYILLLFNLAIRQPTSILISFYQILVVISRQLLQRVLLIVIITKDKLISIFLSIIKISHVVISMYVVCPKYVIELS